MSEQTNTTFYLGDAVRMSANGVEWTVVPTTLLTVSGQLADVVTLRSVRGATRTVPRADTERLELVRRGGAGAAADLAAWLEAERVYLEANPAAVQQHERAVTVAAQHAAGDHSECEREECEHADEWERALNAAMDVGGSDRTARGEFLAEVAGYYLESQIFYQTCQDHQQCSDGGGQLRDHGLSTDDIAPAVRREVRAHIGGIIVAHPLAFRMWVAFAGDDVDDWATNYYLTRERHGAGFWDRGAGALGEMWTAVAHGEGEADTLWLPVRIEDVLAAVEREHGPGTLAGDAGVASPDALDSVGARELIDYRDAALEAIRWEVVEEAGDLATMDNDNAVEAARNAIEVYTGPLWDIFRDLGLFHYADEWGELLGGDGQTLEIAAENFSNLPMTALNWLASTVGSQIFDAVREEWERAADIVRTGGVYPEPIQP